MREKKGRERKKVEEEFMGIKLKRGIVRRGNSTPSPTWKFGFTHSSSLSARKLGAKLRQIQPFIDNVSHHRQPVMGFQSPDSPIDQPPSASSLRRYIATSLIQHHRSVGHHQPVSLASFVSSSLEAAPYDPTVTPMTSLGFKGQIRDGNYSINTSNELLKVLNRIWTLEEQHTLNSSLVKELKSQLERSRAQIKDLLQEKKRDRQEMKSKDQEQVQSIRKEIEDERNLRKHSERIHRKLAKELSQVKSSFSSAIKERESERKGRLLLEKLCDEFAKGIRDYEQEIRSMKQKFDKETVIREQPERLILHISEAWLDERMQMNLAESQAYSAAKSSSIVDKLSSEIEIFLSATRSKRHSVESFHFNEAPQKADLEEASCRSGSNCFASNLVSSAKQRQNSKEIVIMNPKKKTQYQKHILGGVKKNSCEAKVVDLGGIGKSSKLSRNCSCSIERSAFRGDDDDIIEQWKSKFSGEEPPQVSVSVSECSSKGVKLENTLKAKLLEARLEGQHHYRIRTSKGSSFS